MLPPSSPGSQIDECRLNGESSPYPPPFVKGDRGVVRQDEDECSEV